MVGKFLIVPLCYFINTAFAKILLESSVDKVELSSLPDKGILVHTKTIVRERKGVHAYFGMITSFQDLYGSGAYCSVMYCLFPLSKIIFREKEKISFIFLIIIEIFL
jgi:hypothetical protein